MLKKVRPYFGIETKLKNIPNDWLTFIEPKIIRATTCWLWQGQCDVYGEPILAHTHPVTKKRTTSRIKSMVMKMFWTGIESREITHKCGNLNCVNPHHLVVSIECWRNKGRKRLAERVNHEKI